MSKKPAKKKQSGDPRKRAAAAAEASIIQNPCPHCEKRERPRGAIWCLECSASAIKRGRGNKPSRDMLRATIIGTAKELGIMDDEGNIIPEEQAA